MRNFILSLKEEQEVQLWPNHLMAKVLPIEIIFHPTNFELFYSREFSSLSKYYYFLLKFSMQFSIAVEEIIFRNEKRKTV